MPRGNERFGNFSSFEKNPHEKKVSENFHKKYSKVFNLFLPFFLNLSNSVLYFIFWNLFHILMHKSL